MSPALTQEQIAELKGPELDAALKDAGIDRNTGGSRIDGVMTAKEARDALTAYYCGSTSAGDAAADGAADGAPDTTSQSADADDDPDSDPYLGINTGAADTDEADAGDAGASGDGTPDTSNAPDDQDDPVLDGGGDTSPNADGPPAGDENPNAPDPAPQKSVEEQRDEQLEAGKATGALKAAAEQRADMTPAEQRAGYKGARPTDGRVDNMTRRSDADVLQGHFCVIDFGDDEHGDEAKRAVERLVGEGNAGAGRADYGVYTDPGVLDDDGYPLTANVLLRDEHAGLVSGVPYGALRPAQAGGRR